MKQHKRMLDAKRSKVHLPFLSFDGITKPVEKKQGTKSPDEKFRGIKLNSDRNLDYFVPTVKIETAKKKSVKKSPKKLKKFEPSLENIQYIPDL